jgi:hypothetical protein
VSGRKIGASSFRKGIDPKAKEARLRRLELRKQATTFASVADDFIERHVKGSGRLLIQRGKSMTSVLV